MEEMGEPVSCSTEVELEGFPLWPEVLILGHVDRDHAGLLGRQHDPLPLGVSDQPSPSAHTTYMGPDTNSYLPRDVCSR